MQRDAQRYRQRLGSTWHIVENELEEILEEDNLLGGYDLEESEYSDMLDYPLSEISEVD